MYIVAVDTVDDKMSHDILEAVHTFSFVDYQDKTMPVSVGTHTHIGFPEHKGPPDFSQSYFRFTTTRQLHYGN